jgi:hypothetical protein
LALKLDISPAVRKGAEMEKLESGEVTTFSKGLNAITLTNNDTEFAHSVDSLAMLGYRCRSHLHQGNERDHEA